MRCLTEEALSLGIAFEKASVVESNRGLFYTKNQWLNDNIYA